MTQTSNSWRTNALIRKKPGAGSGSYWGVPPADGGPGKGAGEGEVGQEKDRNRRGTETQVGQRVRGQRKTWSHHPLLSAALLG